MKIAMFVLLIPFKILRRMMGMGLAIVLPIIMLKIFTSVTGAWKSKLTGESSPKASRSGTFVKKEE
jgi:hypothetical protein